MDTVVITAMDITRDITMAVTMVGIMGTDIVGTDIVGTDMVIMEVDIIGQSKNHILAITAEVQDIVVPLIEAATRVTGVAIEVGL
jgi:hypothetical protein